MKKLFLLCVLALGVCSMTYAQKSKSSKQVQPAEAAQSVQAANVEETVVEPQSKESGNGDSLLAVSFTMPRAEETHIELELSDAIKNYLGIPLDPNAPEPANPIVKEKEALTELDKTVASLKDEFEKLWMNYLFYSAISRNLPNNTNYLQTKKEVIDKLLKLFPGVPDVAMLELEGKEGITDEDIIRVNTNIINANPDYVNAYLDRGLSLWNLGKTKEACEDFSRLPNKEELPYYRECAEIMGW